MEMLLGFCLLISTAFVKGVQISASVSGSTFTCRQDNENIVLTCTVTGALTSSVDWNKDGTLQTTCTNAADDLCVNGPSYSEARYTFTSTVAQKEFLFHISASQVADDGTYTCQHLTETATFSMTSCKCPVESVEDGQVNTTSATVAVGTVVGITCDAGYTLQGSSELTCQADQTWNNQWPTCEPPTTTTNTTPTTTQSPPFVKQPIFYVIIAAVVVIVIMVPILLCICKRRKRQKRGENNENGTIGKDSNITFKERTGAFNSDKTEMKSVNKSVDTDYDAQGQHPGSPVIKYSNTQSTSNVREVKRL